MKPYSAYYLRGKPAFTFKKKFGENFIEKIAVYDAHDNLIGKVNRVFGGGLFLEKEVVNGRKALKVIRKGKDGQLKVETMKFEDE